MKKTLLLLLPALLFAQSFMISNIPLPKSYIQNLDPYICDEDCLQEYIDKEMIFSFLAHADKKLANPAQDEIRAMNIAVFNLGHFNADGELKIAMLLPYKKIGKYASSTTNAAFAYLMSKNHSFMLKSYKIESEEQGALEIALEKIREDGFGYVIAPLTQKGAESLISIDADINIYIPTIHRDDVVSNSPYLLFGGIDYKLQSDMLLKEAISPLVIFSDKSQTGQKLAGYQEEQFLHPHPEPVDDSNSFLFGNEISVYQDVSDTQELQRAAEIESRKSIKYFLSRQTTNLEHYLKENKRILNASFFINTPIIKSGMVVSQLTLYDANATNILSTQINYDPLLLSMTQYIDRKEMIVANSITKRNNVIIETNNLLGNDILYDWINYTTTVGIDYYYSEITGADREYMIDMKENQMHYETELLRPSVSRFVPYISLLK